MIDNINEIIRVAKSWDRKTIYGVPGCPKETCAFFVRQVFRTALHESGIMRIAHSRPYYLQNQIPQLPTNENFADGLAGDIVGRKIRPDQMQPGDLLFFRDTYRGDFPAGSITHVGICIGAKGLMADSSGGQCHVRDAHKTFRDLLVEVRRPHCLVSTTRMTGTAISLKNGQITALVSGAKQHRLDLVIRFGNPVSRRVNIGTPQGVHSFGSFAASGSGSGSGSARKIPRPQLQHNDHAAGYGSGFGSGGAGIGGGSGSGFAAGHGGAMVGGSRGLQVLIDGKSFPFKYVTLDIDNAANGNRLKLFHHDGLTRVFAGGNEAKSLDLIAKMENGILHLWINGKEIGTRNANIRIT